MRRLGFLIWRTHQPILNFRLWWQQVEKKGGCRPRHDTRLDACLMVTWLEFLHTVSHIIWKVHIDNVASNLTLRYLGSALAPSFLVSFRPLYMQHYHLSGKSSNGGVFHAGATRVANITSRIARGQRLQQLVVNRLH